jgi:ribonucleoside-triphosphate reductase
MVSQLRKRDGTLVLFNKQKIIDAIWKAMSAVGEGDMEQSKKLASNIEDILNVKYHDMAAPSVENVQDIIEDVLMINGFTKAAKAYILYRKQHQQLRDVAEIISSVEIIDNYINERDWRVRENANMTYSLQGLNNHIAGIVVSNYWLNKLYPPKIAEKHKQGEFHIHDLSVLGAYCVGWDLNDLLKVGFRGVPGKVECSPPKHFRSALGQTINYIYTLQGETAGAQAFSDFDTYLATFIRYDKLNYKGVRQAVQEYLYNMNVPTRVGFQTPFSNITLNLSPPSYMKDMQVMVGGKLMDETYDDFQDEIDMFNTAFTEIMMHGDASGRVFTFPIPTYNITKDFDWDSDTDVMKGVFEMTAKYGVPYFSNFINSDMKPEDARSMCCHLRLDTRQLRKRGGGLFGANPLTGSVGVVTINMPRIGYVSKDEAQYFEYLGELMDFAKESLIIKRKVLEKYTNLGLYPYSRFYLREIKKAYNEYWINHFSTIGLIGLNESMLNFIGTDLVSSEGYKFGLKVMDFMRERLIDYQQDEGHYYNLEATPAEGTSYRLARVDKKKYSDIITANEQRVKEHNAAPDYTNSSLFEVGAQLVIFDALNLQDEFQTKYSGGTVFHTFLGEKVYDWRMTRELVKKIATNFKLPYFTMTPTFSVCPQHGYLPREHKYCPVCDREIGYSNMQKVRESGGQVDEELFNEVKKKRNMCEIYSRVVGYIRPVRQWNDGKKEEFIQRHAYG